jgi:predicted dehydrogenase
VSNNQVLSVAFPRVPLSLHLARVSAKHRTMSTKTCRWGILSTAGIAKKNWQAIRCSGNATLTAVASRGVAKAEAFISECQAEAPFEQVPCAFGSYDELIASPEVDAVYIPLPTGLRKEWVIKAAQAGKHVLVEKPVGCDAAEVEAMIAVCRAADVQFMDGVMFMHSTRLPAMRAVLDDGASIGAIRRVGVQFTFNGGEEFLRSNIRSDARLEPQGCMGDLGWYCIRFALWAMKHEMPARVRGSLIAEHRRADSPAAIPTEFSGELFFSSGATAGFYCSFRTENSQVATIAGERGYLQLRDFVLPFSGREMSFQVTGSQFKAEGCRFDMIEGRCDHVLYETSSSEADSQETNMIRTFSSSVIGGQPDWTWADITLKTQRVMDACLESARRGAEVVLK